MSGPGAWDGKGGTRAGVPKGGGKTGPRGDDPGQIRAIGGTRGPTGGRRRARRAETHRCLARERPSASRVARGPAEALARVPSRAEPEPRAGKHADATLRRWAARSAPTPGPVASVRRLGTPRETGDGRAVASGASVPRRGRPARSRVRGRGPRTDRLANERTNAQTNRADWMMCGRFGRRGERRSAERSASTSLYSRARGTNRTDWRERENVVEACILLRAPRLVQGIRAHSERARSSPPDRGEAIEYRP
jgi:hypothetical protein